MHIRFSAMSRFRISPALWDKIHHYSSFPQTGGELPERQTSFRWLTPLSSACSVSLQQMVLFGQNPSQGTLLKASQFLAEELPIRLSHRVKELDELPDGLAEMDGVRRVKEWYAESFQVRNHVLVGTTSPSAERNICFRTLSPFHHPSLRHIFETL